MTFSGLDRFRFRRLQGFFSPLLCSRLCLLTVIHGELQNQKGHKNYTREFSQTFFPARWQFRTSYDRIDRPIALVSFILGIFPKLFGQAQSQGRVHLVSQSDRLLEPVRAQSAETRREDCPQPCAHRSKSWESLRKDEEKPPYKSPKMPLYVCTSSRITKERFSNRSFHLS